MHRHVNSKKYTNSHYEVYCPFEKVFTNLTDLDKYDTKYVQYRSNIKLHSDAIHMIAYNVTDNSVMTCSSDGTLINLIFEGKNKKVHK